MPTRKSTDKGKSDAIRWTALTHAGGNAKNVPALLGDLTKKSTREEADEQLRDLLVAKGKAFSASGPALAQLVALAGQKKLEGRSSFVELAIWILALGDADKVDRTGIDPTIPELAKRYRSPEAKEVLEIATASAKLVTTLVDDKDATLRAAAAHFLGLLPAVDADVIDALGSRLISEAEEGAQMSLVLALGTLGRNAAEQRKAAVGFITAFHERSGLTLLAKGAAALAAAWAGRGPTSDDLSLLFRGMGRLSPMSESAGNDESWRRGVSWGSGRVDLLALESLRSDEVTREVAIRALALALRTTPLPRSNPLSEEWPNIVLREAGFSKSKQPLVARALSERQRSLLIDLSQLPSEGAFDAYGIPPDVRSRRRFLGIDPPSIMERELPLGPDRKPLPVWRIALKVFDEFKRANRNANVLMEPEKLLSYARKSALSSLSEAEWLDVWTELQAKAYGCLTIPIHVVKAALDESTPSERLAYARRWADELRRLPDAGPSSSHVFHALSRDLAPDESYPEEYEDVFTFRGLDGDIPRLFAKIAPAHRETVAQREIDHLPQIADMVLRVADLAPKSAAEFKERRREK